MRKMDRWVSFCTSTETALRDRRKRRENGGFEAKVARIHSMSGCSLAYKGQESSGVLPESTASRTAPASRLARRVGNEEASGSIGSFVELPIWPGSCRRLSAGTERLLSFRPPPDPVLACWCRLQTAYYGLHSAR